MVRSLVAFAIIFRNVCLTVQIMEYKLALLAYTTTAL